MLSVPWILVINLFIDLNENPTCCKIIYFSWFNNLLALVYHACLLCILTPPPSKENSSKMLFCLPWETLISKKSTWCLKLVFNSKLPSIYLIYQYQYMDLTIRVCVKLSFSWRVSGRSSKEFSKEISKFLK